MRNLIKFAQKRPAIASLGYSVLKNIWNVQANFVDYGYPSNPSHASISYDKVVTYNKNRPYGPKKKICYAPFNNLHFQMNGDVSSCSFNYDFILGNVNQASIKEIWFGEKAENFRKTLANYNFHKCQSCQNVLDAGNFSSFPPLKYDIYSSDATTYPTQMSFEISDLCNYECVMCNENFSSLIRKNRAKLPPLKLRYPDAFFEELKEFIPHLKITTFIGGEPLLIKQYFTIWEMILKDNKDCLMHIQTNGSYLPPRFLEMLESGQFDLGVSIDGITKETFESIRINANFDEVQQNIRTLKSFADRGKISMNINFCPLTLNWKELPGMVEYASSLAVPLKIVNVENPRHLSLHHRSATYLQEILHHYQTIHFDDIKNADSIITKKNIKALTDLIKQIEFLIADANKREAYFESMLNQYPQTLEGVFTELFFSNKLFANFSIEEQKNIAEEIMTSIHDKTTDISIINRVILRVYYMLVFFDHTAESDASVNKSTAIKILKDAVAEFYLLESDNTN
ncbi:MAG: SPASM domain-containing protein [Chitinophagales bacterium]